MQEEEEEITRPRRSYERDIKGQSGRRSFERDSGPKYIYPATPEDEAVLTPLTPVEDTITHLPVCATARTEEVPPWLWL